MALNLYPPLIGLSRRSSQPCQLGLYLTSRVVQDPHDYSAAGERATHHDRPAQPGPGGEPGVLPARKSAWSR